MEFGSIHHGYSEFVLLDFHTCFRMKQWFVFFFFFFLDSLHGRREEGGSIRKDY